MHPIISLFSEKIVLSYCLELFFKKRNFSITNLLEFFNFAKNFDKDTVIMSVGELTFKQELQIMKAVREKQTVKEIKQNTGASSEQVISLLMDSNRI